MTHRHHPPAPELTRAALTSHDAAVYLGVGYSTMKKWRLEGIGPNYAKVGRSVLYRVEDLDSFLADHLVSKPKKV